jgi:hypothetical protein
MLGHQFDVRWSAKLAASTQLAEANLDEIEALQPDW